jgi:methyl-accepting chemotaxis protein
VSTVEGTEQAFEALNQVVTQIQQIHDHISQVATAAEQQSAVSDTINQNLMRIGDAATTLGQEANASQRLSEALNRRPPPWQASWIDCEPDGRRK